jgi:hypothetical protein
MPAMSSPYQVALGSAFKTLHSHVQRAHLPPLVAAGTFDVEHGSTWFAPLLARLLKLPVAGRAQSVRLELRGEGDRLLWTRHIGAVRVATRQHAAGTHIVERAGIGAIVFAVTVENGAMVYTQASFTVAKVPLPRAVAPHVSARVSSTRGGWHVEVHVAWRARLVCRYAGPMATR